MGPRHFNTVLTFEDPFFEEYLASWLQDRVGIKLKDLYDEEIHYPPKP